MRFHIHRWTSWEDREIAYQRLGLYYQYRIELYQVQERRCKVCNYSDIRGR